MNIQHIAIWVKDLELSKAFYTRYFRCVSNDKYQNVAKGFTSYFLRFMNGVCLELMHCDGLNNRASQPAEGFAHIALGVGTGADVDALTQRLAMDGFSVLSQPRTTGDGYYESLVLDPEGNQLELVAFPELAVVEASPADAPRLLYLQKLCYLQEADLYNDYSIPPLTQTIADTLADFEQQVILKIEENGRIIGSVRGYVADEICFIGKLMVDPLNQNRGLGARLLLAIEHRFVGVKAYELFTGFRSEKNLYLYSKHGYEPYKNEVVHENLSLTFMRKASLL